MKRLITSILFVFFASCFSYAANKMSMVTYFPVPYVAYSQVNVDQQLDVGLTNTCTMNLGCRESGTNLNANKVNLKSGKLELNQGKGVLGDKILLGSGSGNGKIQFSNVRIQGGDMQSLNAQEMNVKELKLFGHKFPPCKGKGGSDGQMHWTSLSLKGAGTDKTELYLVCGGTAPSTGTGPEPDSAYDWDPTGNIVSCKMGVSTYCEEIKKHNPKWFQQAFCSGVTGIFIVESSKENCPPVSSSGKKCFVPKGYNEPGCEPGDVVRLNGKVLSGNDEIIVFTAYEYKSNPPRF